MNYRLFQDFVEGRKGQILDSALTVFSDKGYNGGSMREIAQLTGITEAALYRHFTGKEDIFNQLLIKAGSIIVQDASRLIDSIDPNNIGQSLNKIVRNRQQAASIYSPFIKTVLLESFRNSKFTETYRTHLSGPIINKLYQVIPKIDEYYRLFYSPEENEKRVRRFASLFIGFFVTSFIFEINDPDILVDSIIKSMGWYDINHRFREDLFLAELTNDFNIIKVDELKKKMKEKEFAQKTTILDLRGKEAFDKDHITGSVQILIKDLPEQYRKVLTEKSKEIIVVCGGGMQSIYAVMYLRMKNYKNVKSLGGGFAKWNS